ncbi:MAG TPA: glucose-6-phosphate isomerase [Pelomicrobium sp.]|nr:glucose-6-phosphate isomerase [Pelomicrobium sp.]
MTRPTATPEWRALAEHRRTLEGAHLRTLFERDPGRARRLTLEAAGLTVDLSKNRVTEETVALLAALARVMDLSGWTARMFGGDRVNDTEDRAALHVALRAERPMVVDGADVMPDVAQVLEHMRRFTDAVRSGTRRGHTGKAFTDVVNIGIGGSDLGPAMAVEALKPYGSPSLRAHFVSNVDASHLLDTLAGLDAETTMFVVASKTFTTLETLANARAARDWLTARLNDRAAVAKHFVAVSTNREEVERFGIESHDMFVFWDWVGGRYSLWSAIGLPIALAIGYDNFRELLAGARAMDTHFREAPVERNAPALLGLLAVWYGNFLGARSHAVLPYDQHLARLPAYLQQLEMESLGKRVDRDGNVVDYDTGVVIWGEPGTNGQHAFFQLLHQGTQLVSADFIVGLAAHHGLPEHQRMLYANCLAQTEALARGRTPEEALAGLAAKGVPAQRAARLAPYQAFPGNRPSTTIVYDRLTPAALGALIALYEHKVFVESVVWNLNAFDQWGVEFGKQLAGVILPELAPGASAGEHDASTRELIRRFRDRAGGSQTGG